MSSTSPSAKTVFLDALEIISAAERRAFLDAQWGNDAVLRAEVEELLRHHELLGPCPDTSSIAETSLAAGIERPGSQIGPYKLLQQIGEGGMGVVYMAEQLEPVRRRVALKIIKPGMDTRQVTARFEAERQALAMMDHVNIARVLDGGATPDGRPFFVMELVHGVPITQYCDDHHLTPRERLELFVPVCQAIQHAHQKGIIHRDVKPSNVMVTLYDGRPVPKVIDFGVAKATEQRLTERTLFTQYGTIVGTLEYMSPEQAEMSALGVDTRSDIYSLGVLLYELLTASTPLSNKRIKDATYPEILRIIKEEEPQRPSTRLSGSGEALAWISANRHTEPAELTKLVRGELDWIVLKALEKDRNRRYETASAFAADVQHYLNDEPVLACPPSAWYRLRKFARKNRTALTAAMGVVLVVVLAVVGLATSTVLIARSLQAETRAKDDLRRDSYFHRITLAHRELSVDNLGGALALLDECPEDLREWEWHYLMRLCRVEPVVLQSRAGGVRGLAFSPNGKRLAAANENRSVGLFDLTTGADLPPLLGHTNKVRSVAFDPVGTRLASASAEGTVKLWDLTTGGVLFTLSGNAGSHASGTYGVTFSPDGRRLAAGDDNGNVNLFDTSDGQELQRLPGHAAMALCVDFSPDGRLLVSGDWAGALRVWDTQSGRLLRTVLGNEVAMSAAKFSHDGRRLVTASYDRFVKVWDVAKLLDAANGDEPLAWRGHDCIIVGLAFSPDGRRLATMGGEDKTVKLWDPLTGREILKLRGHTFFGICVVFSPDGQRLASSGLDGTIRIWDATPLDANQGQELLTLRHNDEVWSVAFSPDGRHIASASFDKTVRLWDAASGEPLHRLLSHSSQVYLLAFSRQRDQLLASVGRDKTARIWDVTTGRQLRAFRTLNDHIYGVTFSPDGKYLLVDDVGAKHVAEGENNAVTVWDVKADQTTPKEIGIVGRHGEPVWCLKFSPDGTLLASASNDGTVRLWRWDPDRPGQLQEPLQSLSVRHYGFGDCAAFTADSQCLVTVAEDHAVKIWNAKTGEVLHTLHGHSGDVVAVAVSPDNRWLASAGEDSTIVLWDTANLSQDSATPQRRHTLRGHTGMVMSLAFSPDSQRLVSGSRDKTVKVWDLTQWEKPVGR